jgi:hypothetical protein
LAFFSKARAAADLIFSRQWRRACRSRSSIPYVYGAAMVFSLFPIAAMAARPVRRRKMA